MKDMAERLARLDRSILRIVKDKAQEIPLALSAFILDRMDSTKPERRKDGSRRLPRNKTDRLRTLYGNLTRAVTPGGKGNLSEVKIKGTDNVAIDFGFDPTTKVTQGPRTGDLRYGMLHEYGGTIQHPGGTPYFIIAGRAYFTTKEKARAWAQEKGYELPVTKPHTITIKARPFLSTGKADFMKDPAGFQAIMDDLLNEVIDELGAL